MSTFRSFGEKCANFLKCIIDAFTIVVKSAGLQSDSLVFPSTCCVAVDKFPQVTGPPYQLGCACEPHKVERIEGRLCVYVQHIGNNKVLSDCI